jgi:hypothetical protein
MALFDSTNKNIDLPIDITKEKKLSRFLGTDKILLSKIRQLKGPEVGNFRAGLYGLIALTGVMGYYYYRCYYEQRIKSGWGYYRLIKALSLNAGKQFYHKGSGHTTWQRSLYYRMPEKEFDVLYRMKSAHITGEFDHNKEILIPKTRNGQEGYDVITPFYYYNTVGMDFNNTAMTADQSTITTPTVIERAAMAVHRGW